jgi:hypothetical protein
VLSALQKEVAAIIASLEEAENFALAGGAALIVRGEVDRRTRDLDFFGLDGDAVDRLVPIVERQLTDAGFGVRRIRSNPGFARLEIDRLGERTEVDLAADARLLPAEPGPNGLLLLSSEELAVDKVLAVFGRAEARDFLDLMAVEAKFDLRHLFELAAEKDHGFSPAVFAQMTEQFRRLGRDEFPIDDDHYERLARTVSRWGLIAQRVELNPVERRDLGLER